STGASPRTSWPPARKLTVADHAHDKVRPSLAGSSMISRVCRQRLGVAIASAAALLASEREANADDAWYLPSQPLVDALIVGGATLAVADVVFTVHDAIVVSHGGPPNHGWSVAEVAVTAPQTAFLDHPLSSTSRTTPATDRYRTRSR